MFKNLFNFSYRRTPLEALGFYIAYMVFIIAVIFFVGGLLGLQIGTSENFSPLAIIPGVLFAAISCLVLSFMILVKKKLTGNVFYVILAVISGILGILIAGSIGLIITSFLATRAPKT